MSTAFKTVESELRSLIRGDCLFDSETREKYSVASSWYKIQPIGVVFPKDEADVQKVIQFCFRENIAVIARGAGTGLAGQAVGMGIVLDFTQHMKRIRGISPSSVDVEPGVVLNDLNDRLVPYNKFFPIDPVSGRLCTIGGMISTNAAGPHGVKYGAMKDHVESLTVVLSNGDLARIIARSENHQAENHSLENIRARLKETLIPNRAEILKAFPKDAVDSDELDLRKIIVGSEGTLAIVVEATLRLAVPPKSRIGAVASFSSYESAVEATLIALTTDPAAIEIMDHTYVSHGRGFSEATERLILPGSVAVLYFEYEGDSADELRSKASSLRSLVKSCNPLEFSILEKDEEQQALRSFREAVSKKINLDDSFGKSSFIEDVAVPLVNMPAYLSGLAAILRRNGIEFSAYGHAGTGNIHCGTFVDLKNPDHFSKIDRVA
ncbi:MAG: FAD linked oxidase domain protein, partial [Bacteroidetes bacterium]|nr:FAD linked oxidase domain protein [Bacteroidota bacterium]